MRAPAAPVAASFAIGIAAALVLTAPPPAVIEAVALAWLGLALGGRRGWVTAAAAAGMLAGICAGPTGAPAVDPERFGVATGSVCGPWTQREWGSSAPFCLDVLRQGSRRDVSGGRLRLELPVGVEAPPLGSLLRVRGVLGRSPGFANERAVPPGPWRLRVKSEAHVQRLAGPPIPAELAEGLRARVRAVFEHAGAGSAGAALARSLLLGDATALPEAWRGALRRSGLAHLIAVSGFNVSLVAAVAAAVGAALPRRGRLALAAVAVAIYLLVVGPAPSVLRASGMSLLALSGLALDRAPLARQGLALLAIAVLGAGPRLIADAGFQLSFAATAGLLCWAPRWGERLPPGWPRPLRLGLAASLAAQAAALPWSVAAFGDLAPAAPLFNLLAAIWASLALIVSIGWTAVGLVAAAPARALLPVLDLVAAPLDGLVALPANPLVSLAWPGGFLAGAMAGALVGALAEGGRWARCAVLLAFAGTAAGHGPGAEPPFEAVFLDVGQGDAALLRHGSEAVLVDGGGAAGYDLGSRTLRPLLADRGIWRIAVAVVTHADLDHCRGLVDLAAYLPIDEIWLPRGARQSPCVRALAARSEARLTELGAGDRRNAAGFRFVALHPARDEPAGVADNDASLVLVAEAGGRRLLFAADIDRGVEAELVLRDRPGLAADVLKVAHHGSAGSSSPAFLHAARPRWAVVSAGIRNSYGHPDVRAIGRLQRAGARVVRTDRDGEIAIEWRALGPWRLSLPGSPRAETVRH